MIKKTKITYNKLVSKFEEKKMKINLKYLLILLTLILFCSLATYTVLAQTQGNTSNIDTKIPYKETQLGIDDQAYKTFVETDKELNNIYKQILKKYKDDKVFISKLQKAELAWIKYRDAEIEAIYPKEDKSNYGSVYPMCKAGILTELTQQRIKELKTWSKGICEGNVCAGSRKTGNDGDCIP